MNQETAILSDEFMVYSLMEPMELVRCVGYEYEMSWIRQNKTQTHMNEPEAVGKDTSNDEDSLQS